MSKPRRAVKSTRVGKIKGRIGLILVGAFCLACGVLKLQSRGPFVYFNDRGLPVYPGGVMAIGIFLVVVAFVPGGKWLQRLVAAKKGKSKGSFIKIL